MTTMLEKAARSLAAHFGCEWETMSDADRDMIRGYARAVLMAVREPDDAGFMAEAMNLDGPLSRGVVSAPEFFTAMIDAILNEGAEHGQA